MHTHRENTEGPLRTVFIMSEIKTTMFNFQILVSVALDMTSLLINKQYHATQLH